MTLQLVDSHCHLDAPEFDGDRADVVARARAAGVIAQVIPAITAASWPALSDACALAPGLYPAWGLHPMFLDQHAPGDLDTLRDWIERHRPVAVGECGLDFFVDGLDPETQRRYFIGQLEVAREYDLPVIIHARRAVEEVIVTLKRIGGLRGVVHSYPGSPEQARQLYDLGFMVGLGGPITYERAQRLHRVVREIPLEQLLLETDAPDQPDAGIRGQRNAPERLVTILEHVARLRDTAPAEIAAATTANACRLFGLDQVGPDQFGLDLPGPDLAAAGRA